MIAFLGFWWICMLTMSVSVSSWLASNSLRFSESLHTPSATQQVRLGKVATLTLPKHFHVELDRSEFQDVLKVYAVSEKAFRDCRVGIEIRVEPALVDDRRVKSLLSEKLRSWLLTFQQFEGRTFLTENAFVGARELKFKGQDAWRLITHHSTYKGRTGPLILQSAKIIVMTAKSGYQIEVIVEVSRYVEKDVSVLPYKTVEKRALSVLESLQRTWKWH